MLEMVRRGAGVGYFVENVITSQEYYDFTVDFVDVMTKQMTHAYDVNKTKKNPNSALGDHFNFDT